MAWIGDGKVSIESMVVAAVANECIAIYSLVRRWRGIVQSAEGAIVAKGAITEGANRERGRRDR